MTEFKETLKDPENKVTKQWAQAIDEDLRKKCGFKGRFGSKDKSIHKQTADIVDIIDPETKFFSLAKYIEVYGDPKATGAKVVSLRLRGGKLVRGVVVRVGEEGIYGMTMKSRGAALEDDVVDNGDEVLFDEQQQEAFAEVGQEVSQGLAGALTHNETSKRLKDHEARRQSQEMQTNNAGSDDDKDADGSDSDSSSSSSDEGSATDSGSEIAPKSKPLKAQAIKQEQSSKTKIAVKKEATQKQKKENKSSNTKGKPGKENRSSSAGSQQTINTGSDTTEQETKKNLDALGKMKQQFEEGAYDDHKGRELQHLCKELKGAADVGSRASRTLVTLGAAPSDPMPTEFKSLVVAVQSIARFLTTFAKGGCFDTLSKAWDDVAVHSKPTCAKAEQLLTSQLGYFCMSQLLEHAVEMCGTSEPACDGKDIKYRVQTLIDDNHKAESSNLLMSQLVAFITGKEKELPSEELEPRKKKLILALGFAEKMSGHLTPSTNNQVDILLSVAKQTTPQLLDSIAACNTPLKNSMIEKFARSAVGKNMLKDAGALQKKLLEESNRQDQTNRLCKELTALPSPPSSPEAEPLLEWGKTTWKSAEGKVAALFAIPQGEGETKALEETLDKAALWTDKAFKQALPLLVCTHANGVVFDQILDLLTKLANVLTQLCGAQKDPQKRNDADAAQKIMGYLRVFSMGLPGKPLALGWASMSAPYILQASKDAAQHKESFKDLEDVLAELTVEGESSELGHLQCAGHIRHGVGKVVGKLVEFLVSMLHPNAEDALPIGLAELKAFVREDGSLNSDVARKLIALQLTTAISQFDVLHGAKQALDKLEPQAVVSNINYMEVGAATKAIPLMQKIAKLEVDINGLPDGLDVDKRIEAYGQIGSILKGFADMQKTGECEATIFLGLGKWITNANDRVTAARDKLIEEGRDQMEKVKNQLQDWKAILKADCTPEATEQLATLGGSIEITEGVKAMNILLKELDAFNSALSGTDSSTQQTNCLREEVAKVRDSGRLQETVRTGAKMLHEKRAGDVDIYYASCKRAKTINDLTRNAKTLVKKLDELKKDAVEAEA